MKNEQLKNPKVLATVREGETTLNPISLPHLDEAIDQMEVYIEKETDRNKRIWLGEILESMRRVCWDLQ